MADWPKDIGILGIHLYLPTTYATLPSAQLSSCWISPYENEPASIAILGDREDTVSIGLTVLSQLLNKYSINPRNIGRLEVGTSDLTDKSKSIKTYMMSLLRESGNCNVEGVTSHASSYGGIQALYNSVAWIESRSWDGRYAVVIVVDCNEDGAGAAALLIGPNAGLVLEKDRAIFMDNEYDLYSPNFNSTDIITEGNLHHSTYIESLLECYNLIQQKTSFSQLNHLADFFIFHSPSLYISQRALCYLTVRDMEIIEAARRRRFDLNNRFIYEMVKNYTGPVWEEKVEPGNSVVKHAGNLGCAAVFGSLCSLVSSKGRDIEVVYR